jgi:hypothetical protein
MTQPLVIGMAILLGFALVILFRRFIPSGSILKPILIIVLAVPYCVHVFLDKRPVVETVVTVVLLVVAVGYFVREFFRARKSHG